jgi:hypothetical protein
MLVNKDKLLLVSGLMWTGVGIMLIIFALRWFSVLSINEIIIVTIGGILLGIAILYFGFRHLAQKNIVRICAYNGKVSIWWFQKVQTYFLIIFMISLGIFLRKSGILPKVLLSPMYMGIGFALFLASFKYYLQIYKYKNVD